MPLAVRSPYLTTWLPGDSLPGTWPTFWTGAVTAITGIARVDGTPFVFMGAPGGGWTVATQTNLATTAAAAQLQSQLGGGHPHTSNADTVGWLNRHWAAPTPADDYFAGPYHVSAATNRSGYDVMVDFEPHWFSDEDSTFPPRLLIYVPPSRRHTRPSAAPARRLTYGP